MTKRRISGRIMAISLKRRSGSGNVRPMACAWRSTSRNTLWNSLFSTERDPVKVPEADWVASVPSPLTSDVVISRAGALSISELCLAKKPSVLVPSPNVAEDHQAKNAQTLVNEQAAIMIRDSEAKEKLVSQALELLNDHNRCKQLSENIGKLGKPHAAEDIVTEIEKLLV